MITQAERSVPRLGAGFVFNAVLKGVCMKNTKILGAGCANRQNTCALVEGVCA